MLCYIRCVWYFKDCGGNIDLHPLTQRLGAVSEWNSARDWWRLLDNGPVAWMCL